MSGEPEVITTLNNKLDRFRGKSFRKANTWENVRNITNSHLTQFQQRDKLYKYQVSLRTKLPNDSTSGIIVVVEIWFDIRNKKSTVYKINIDSDDPISAYDRAMKVIR